MKKRFTIFLILIFILGLVPINFSLAITQNQINSEVQVVCPDNQDNWSSGSGTIISSTGIILTNKHVVTGADGQITSYCLVGKSKGINQYADFSDKYIAEVKYYSISNDLDVAILYIINPGNYDYFNIFDSSSNFLKKNDAVEAVGYPGYNDLKLINTNGKFVGLGSGYLKNYIEATTYINHGNSGGTAYNYNQFVGIPSLGVETETGLKYYFLSIDSIKNWFTETFGANYSTEILGYQPTVTKPEIVLPPDYTPPYQNYFFVSFYGLDDNNKEIYRGNRYGDTNQALYEFKKIRFGWEENCSEESCIKDDVTKIKGYFYYFGDNPTANPRSEGKYISSKDLIGSGGTNVKLPEIFELKEGDKKYFILQAEDENNNISDNILNFEYTYEPERFKDINSIDVKDSKNKMIGNLKYPTKEEIPACVNSHYCDRNVELGYIVTEIYTNQDVLYLYPNYDYEIDGLVYYISYNDDIYWTDKSRVGFTTSDNFIKITNISGRKKINLFIKPFKNSLNSFLGKHYVLTVNYNKNVSSKIITKKKESLDGYSSNGYGSGFAELKFNTIDESLLKRLSGYILLQTESHGEAWYVNPKDGKRYYMADGNKAYDVMRNFGIGITNQDLDKIKSSKTVAKKSSGKIFLQVESRGEAYYIDFNGVAHYLKNGAAAYEVMRSLGLGITNTDLDKISEGNL